MSWKKIEKTVVKNWPVLLILVVLQLISTIPGYFLSGWTSVSVTRVFVVVTSVVGFFAVTMMITITSGDS
jgi:hypothetical protein